MASTSTVEYNSSTIHNVQPGQYGNLTVGGGTASTSRLLNVKMLAGNTIVTGKLTLTPGSNLELGAYALTVLSSGSITGADKTAYVVTDGAGRLRVLVLRAASSSVAGTQVAFPVGSSFTSLGLTQKMSVMASKAKQSHQNDRRRCRSNAIAALRSP